MLKAEEKGKGNMVKHHLLVVIAVISGVACGWAVEPKLLDDFEDGNIENCAKGSGIGG